LRMAELEAQGVSFASFKAMKEFMGKEMEAAKSKKKQFGGVEGQAASLAAQFEDMDSGDLPMIKLGDASVAAPFTSKMPSIKNCVDIVRQGRCTLVSSMQMVRFFWVVSFVKCVLLVTNFVLFAIHHAVPNNGFAMSDQLVLTIGALSGWCEIRRLPNDSHGTAWFDQFHVGVAVEAS
jgi:magnesium-transporting ATPase (P-type)